jgi:hypothetical protein
LISLGAQLPLRQLLELEKVHACLHLPMMNPSPRESTSPSTGKLFAPPIKSALPRQPSIR